MSATKLLPKSLWIVMLAILSTGTYTSAQVCTPNFQKTYGGNGSDEGFDIVNTQDGGSIVAGRTTSGRSDMNGVLMKLDVQGAIQWTKSYGQSFYDELLKVKQTSDGGFVATGRTITSGTSPGDAWIIRTDGIGNPLWSRQLPSSNGPTRSKDIIQLNDGGFVLALNVNDSSTQSDAMLVRLDVNGNLIWSRSYDNGSGDGFYTVTQDGDYLIAAGYTTNGNRAGIASKVNLADGSLVWTKKFSSSDRQGEVVRVDLIPNGYIFAVLAKYISPSDPYANALLFLVKIQNEIVTVNKGHFSIIAGLSYRLGHMNLKFAGDSSFVFAVSDSTSTRNSVYHKVVMNGFSTGFNRKVDGYHYVNSLEGIDRFGDKGLMLSGTIRDWNTSNKIQVLKTDWDGSYGSCTGSAFVMGADTTQILYVTAFDWTQNLASTLSDIPVDAAEASITFTEQTVCEKMDCIPESAVNDKSCYATTLTGYWNKYELIALESLKVSDGYVMCGYNRRTYQPMVTKVGFSGAVLWSKTINSDHHSLWLSHIRLLNDGNILLAGEGGYTVKHEGYTITGYIKMTPSGNVLWSKYMKGFPADLKVNGDGTITLLHYPDEASWGQMAISKLDADGHLLDRKRLNKSGEIIPTFHRMVLDGNYMYAVGEAYNSIVLEKFQLDGKRIWSRRFSPNDKEAWVEGVYLIGDSVYFTARIITPVGWGGKQNLVLVKVGKDGNGLNGVIIQQDFIVYSPQFFQGINTHRFHTSMTSDGNFVVADRIPDSPDPSIALIKFSPTGKILWAKKYSGMATHVITSIQSDESGLTISGLLMSTNTTTGTPFYNPLLIHTNNEGEVLPGTGTNCNAISFTTSAVPINLADRFLYAACTPNVDFLEWIERSDQTFERHLETIATYSCGIKADCSLIELSGPSTMCLSANAVLYEAQRNPGCVVPTLWKFDTAYVQMVATTESSRSFVFKRAGTTKIYASIPTTCKIYIDSVELTILPSADILNLGRDTAICTGSKVVLNAKKGYTSYLWQDGSTDSTFTITEPGTYRVTVSDACNKTYTDETIVIAHPPIAFSAGPDRVKCNNDTLHLSAPDGFMNYSWSPAYNITSQLSQQVVVKPTLDTVYFVKAEKSPGCFAYDTVRVDVFHTPEIDFGLDKSFCEGDSLILDAGAGFTSYNWSTGEKTQQIVVKKVGQYNVSGTSDIGCKSVGTTKVVSTWPLPKVNLNKNDGLCFGEQRVLNAGNFSSYQWQDNSINQSYTVNAPGRYYVTVTDNNKCRASDTTVITSVYALPHNFLPPDDAICSYSKTNLKANQSYSSYLWSNGSNSSNIDVAKSGIYWLEVTDKHNCKGKDSITLVPKLDCMSGVYIATAFTPNNDGKNDVFRAQVFGVAKQFELIIYNRWGEVVFKTNEASKGWNGKINGIEQYSGVYIWTCHYQLEEGEDKVEKGTVTLIH